MNRTQIMKAAFYDELEKISGEMQGFTRVGRKPISIERMLENELEQDLPSEVFGSEEKVAFSITPEGHEFDADQAAIRGESAAKQMELSQRHHAMGSSKRVGDFMNVLRFGPNTLRDPRHEAYVERKHREGKNAWNPFGGALTPSKYERDGSTLQYGEMRTGHKFKSKDSRPKEKKSSVGTDAAKAGKSAAYKTLGLMGTGAGIYHIGRKAEEDRRLGRQVRLQQGM